MFKQARQGDLLIRRIDDIPSEVSVMNDKVLAHGEVTGHKHQMLATQVMRSAEKDIKIQYLEIVDPDTLVHEEHASITFEPGNYQVVHQREFDYGARFDSAVSNSKRTFARDVLD